MFTREARMVSSVASNTAARRQSEGVRATAMEGLLRPREGIGGLSSVGSTMAENILQSPGRPNLISIDEILTARPQQPIATTRARGWNGVTVDLHRPYFGCAESYAGLDHHLICYCPSGGAKLVQSRAGVVHKSVITAGTSYIMPAGYPSTWEGDSGLSARLRMPTSLVASAAEQPGPRKRSSGNPQRVSGARSHDRASCANSARRN